MILRKNYIISKTTIALIPISHEKFHTKIIDEKGIYYSSKRPIEIVDDSCFNERAPYNGERRGIRRFTDFRLKVPTPTGIKPSIYVIPTHSPEQFECVWFLAHQFQVAYKLHNSRTIIVLTNDVRVEVTESLFKLFEQLKKTLLFSTRLSPSRKFWLCLNSTNVRIIRQTRTYHHFLVDKKQVGEYKKLRLNKNDTGEE